MTTSIRSNSAIADSRRLEPGSTGWVASDLDDPRIESDWIRGRFEMIEGVIAPMAPAYLDGSLALNRLTRIVESHLLATGGEGEFCHEVDLVVSESRVLLPDVMLVTAEFQKAQAEAVQHAGTRRTRILVPPMLVIESVSPGHERHDLVLKKQWYAEFGIPNYWVLDAFAHSLICYARKGPLYEVDCEGCESEEMKPSVFAPLTIRLKELWRPVSKP